LFVIGGGTAAVEEYVAAERRWVSVPDMPRAVRWVAAVALEGKLLVIGGYVLPDRRVSFCGAGVRIIRIVRMYIVSLCMFRALPQIGVCP